MSIEINWPDDNDEASCRWGVIEHSCPRPDRGEVGHLMMATPEYVQRLLTDGPTTTSHGALHSVTCVGGRCFAHIEHAGRTWTWELFAAHFADGEGPDILIGRWPD